MQDLSIVITTLAVAAGLALAVERVLELLKSLLALENGFLHKNHRKAVLGRVDLSIAKARQSLALAGDAEVLDHSIEEPVVLVSDGAAVAINLTAADSELEESYLPPAIAIIPVECTSQVTTIKKLFLQLVSLGVGIILADLFNIRLLDILLGGIPHIGIGLNSSLDIVLSGIVIGGGSQPIHLLMRFLTDRKTLLAQGGSTTQTKSVLSPAAPSAGVALVEEALEVQVIKTTHSRFAWKNIDYLGGINPGSMDRVHLRGRDPNLIVFHHTAMSDKRSFRDIVDEFLVRKKWLTGYHCVIMPDGSIKPFCRWDRYGNHAKGKNRYSLGICFHGNFHTDGKDRYSNVDGRFGVKNPSQAQLMAGARVIALWTQLYPDIELDFNKHILPHREAMPNHTVCPGSNFPTAGLQVMVKDFIENWQQSEHAQAEIIKFKQRQYIYV